jgi:hypothetical protein
MSDDLFKKSLDPAVWPNGAGVAIREFVNRPKNVWGSIVEGDTGNSI